MKEYTLKKNAWYSKLFTYIWAMDVTHFQNVCPFFWLTVFNIIVFIPYSILFILYRTFSYFIKPIYTKYRDKKIVEKNAIIQQYIDNPELLMEYYKNFDYKKVYKLYFDNHLYNYHQIAMVFIKIYDINRRNIEAKRKSEKLKVINEIVRNMPNIFKVLYILLCIFLLGGFIYIVITAPFSKLFPVIIVFSALGLISFITFYLIPKLGKYCPGVNWE